LDPLNLSAIKQSTTEVLAEIPGLENFIEGVRQSLTASVQEVLTEAVGAVADGIGQLARIGYSLDGAHLDLTVDPIILPPLPKITARLVLSIPIEKDK
jgi:hypothetical protein